MSTALTPPAASPVAPTSRVQARGVGFGGVLRSEWTKLRSLRSTWWSVLAAFVVTVGLSLLIDWAIVSSWDQASAQDKATFDPTSNSLNGVGLGQLALAVLGVLVISAEYSTGGIRQSFIAVPRRLLVLGAKAVTLAVLSLVVGIVIAFVAFLPGQAIFASQDVGVSLGDPHVLRAVIGAGLYMAGCAMFGLALGTLVRNTPGGITGVVALLFVLPLLTLAVPGKIGDTLTKYFTSNAGASISTTITPENMLSPWAGYAVFTLEWLVLLAVGALLVKRRDT